MQPDLHLLFCFCGFCFAWQNVADSLELPGKSLIWWSEGKHAGTALMQLLPPVGVSAVWKPSEDFAGNFFFVVVVFINVELCF